MSSTRYAVQPDVVMQQTEDGLVLVHLASNRIYTLNETAGRFWELLAQGLEEDAIAARMMSEFAVTRARWDEESAQILNSLLAERLIAQV